MYLSTNNGTSWSSTSHTNLYPVVYSLAVSETTLLAGTNKHGVCVSRDTGATWSTTGVALLNRSVFDMAVSGKNLYCVTDSGVFRSTDEGTSWTAVNSGLPDTAGKALAVSDTNVFEGGKGIFISTNNGTSWTDVSDGLTTNLVNDLAISGSNIFAAPFQDGVWRRPLSEMITSVHETAGGGRPKNFSLGQNYPNPFNPSTTINYDVPTLSKVKLSIFNILGQEVRRLVDEEQIPGKYHISFDAAKLPSGVYFYKLAAGKYYGIKKMMLIK